MPKNRRCQSAPIQFGPALCALLLCLFIGGSAVGYVWQKNQLFALHQQKKECEVSLDDLRRNNEALSRVASELLSPRNLEAQVRAMNLGLVPPDPNQVVRLAEGGAAMAEPALGQMIARGAGGAFGVP